MAVGKSEASIFEGTVMHKRFFPKENGFTYKMFYLCLPLSEIDNLPLSQKKFAPLSFRSEDHANRDSNNLEEWIRNILCEHNLERADGNIMLVTLPRIFGYVFNPVSFWLCFDKDENLQAVLCEVNNTFGETHSYLCHDPTNKPITKDTVLQADKLFHVSPFLKREGHYDFRFDIRDRRYGFWIDFYDAQGQKQLVTNLIGTLNPMTEKSLKALPWRYPLITFKAIALIHWQALKLIVKGIKHIKKPMQNPVKLSQTRDQTYKDLTAP